MTRLDNKVALVSGGAAGLGKAIAQRLAADGARVVISDIQSGLGQATAAECGFLFLEHDVSDEARWLAVIREIEQRCGGLNILVNNAGILGPMDAADPQSTRLVDWKRVFAVNVDGVFLGCRVSIPALQRAGGGSIVNISSIAGLTATPYATAYGASKAAVRQLTKSVAQHCAELRLNIRCNSVHPGNVQTPSEQGQSMWSRYAADNARARQVPFETILEEACSYVPLGNLTLPEDVAAAVAFLASDDARHITGEKLVVDGGVLSCDTFQPRANRPALRQTADG